MGKSILQDFFRQAPALFSPSRVFHFSRLGKQARIAQDARVKLEHIGISDSELEGFANAFFSENIIGEIMIDVRELKPGRAVGGGAFQSAIVIFCSFFGLSML